MWRSRGIEGLPRQCPGPADCRRSMEGTCPIADEMLDQAGQWLHHENDSAA